MVWDIVLSQTCLANYRQIGEFSVWSFVGSGFLENYPSHSSIDFIRYTVLRDPSGCRSSSVHCFFLRVFLYVLYKSNHILPLFRRKYFPWNMRRCLSNVFSVSFDFMPYLSKVFLCINYHLNWVRPVLFNSSLPVFCDEQTGWIIFSFYWQM